MAPKELFPDFGQLPGGSPEVASENLFGAFVRPDATQGPFPGFGQLPGGSPEVASEGLFGALFRADGSQGPFPRFRLAARWLASGGL